MVEVQLKAMLSWHADELTKEGKHSFMSHSASLFLSMKKMMPLSANSIVFLDMTILAKSGITFFEHGKK